MRNIEINITTARIKSYSVTLEEDNPRVTATIGLFAGDELISEYSISTASWADEHKRFNISPDLMQSILGASHELEKVVTRHCEERQLRLTEGQSKGDE